MKFNKSNLNKPLLNFQIVFIIFQYFCCTHISQTHWLTWQVHFLFMCVSHFVSVFSHFKLSLGFIFFLHSIHYKYSQLQLSQNLRMYVCMYVRTNFGAAYNLHKLTYGSEIWYMCSLAKYPGVFFSFFLNSIFFVRYPPFTGISRHLTSFKSK